MAHEIVVAPRVVNTPLRYASTADAARTPMQTLVLKSAARAGELSRTVGLAWHRLRNPPPRKRVARMLVVVPAHNEGDPNHAHPTKRAALGTTPIERTLDSLLRQTRRPDRIVVVVNNSTDDTEARARQIKGVTVVVLNDNADKKVGALNYAWQEWSVGYDFIAGVDADTELDPECLQQLEEEIVRRPDAAGVMARYTVHQNEASGFVQNALVRAQRLDFSSWVDESLAQNRETYVLGGQATLFRREALAQVQKQHHRTGPWNPTADVEDMELTWRMREDNRLALTSPNARAYVGAMFTFKALWAQRLKWARGMAALLKNTGVTSTTLMPWKQQLGLLLNGLIRVMLLFLLPASLVAGQFVWAWFWLTPILLSVILNVRSALRVPHRSKGDILHALLIFPAELYLWFQLAVTSTAWFKVLTDSRSDAWATQSKAEAGHSSGWWKPLFVLVGIIAVIFGAGVLWNQVAPDAQRYVLTTGWAVLSVLTVAQCLVMLRRIMRRYHGVRP